jgi:hypothetical protein
MPRGAAEVADVFRRYGEAIRQQHGASLSTVQRRVMTAILSCAKLRIGCAPRRHAKNALHYAKYFSMLPFGPEPVTTFAQGWFDLAAAQKPKPKTVAIVATDAEFQHKAAESAREQAKARGIEIVYDRAYPQATVDFTPIVRAVQAAQPDLVYVAAYPSDTVGVLRAVEEVGLKTKMLGGALPDCRRQRSRCSSARRPMGSSISTCGNRSRQCNSPASWIS